MVPLVRPKFWMVPVKTAPTVVSAILEQMQTLLTSLSIELASEAALGSSEVTLSAATESPRFAVLRLSVVLSANWDALNWSTQLELLCAIASSAEKEPGISLDSEPASSETAAGVCGSGTLCGAGVGAADAPAEVDGALPAFDAGPPRDRNSSVTRSTFIESRIRWPTEGSSARTVNDTSDWFWPKRRRRLVMIHVVHRR